MAVATGRLGLSAVPAGRALLVLAPQQGHVAAPPQRRPRHAGAAQPARQPAQPDGQGRMRAPAADPDGSLNQSPTGSAPSTRSAASATVPARSVPACSSGTPGSRSAVRTVSCTLLPIRTRTMIHKATRALPSTCRNLPEPQRTGVPGCRLARRGRAGRGGAAGMAVGPLRGSRLWRARADRHDATGMSRST